MDVVLDVAVGGVIVVMSGLVSWVLADTAWHLVQCWRGR